MKEALFLDRDGVVNRMVKYDYGWDSPQKLQDVRLVKDIEKIISWANQNKIPVIEVSNQPGVAKGKMTQDVSDVIEERVHRLLGEKESQINKTYICPHHPDAVIPELKIICDCRKPKPGLLIKAAGELSIDLKKSLILGDKENDVLAGKSAGCKTIIFVHNEDEDDKVADAKKVRADYSISEMSEALPILTEVFK
jgi:histidinol-phosphate phosphatase family protein